jgi:hypothetical protein
MCIDAVVGREESNVWDEISRLGREAASYYDFLTGQMVAPLGSGAVTVSEVRRWCKEFCEGRMTWAHFSSGMVLGVDPQEIIAEYIKSEEWFEFLRGYDEEAAFERTRAEAHKLTAMAALPKYLVGKVKVWVRQPDGTSVEISSLEKPIEFSDKFEKNLGAVCKCDMKDLMSGVPHASDCPEKPIR